MQCSATTGKSPAYFAAVQAAGPHEAPLGMRFVNWKRCALAPARAPAAAPAPAAAARRRSPPPRAAPACRGEPRAAAAGRPSFPLPTLVGPDAPTPKHPRTTNPALTHPQPPHASNRFPHRTHRRPLLKPRNFANPTRHQPPPPRSKSDLRQGLSERGPHIATRPGLTHSQTQQSLRPAASQTYVLTLPPPGPNTPANRNNPSAPQQVQLPQGLPERGPRGHTRKLEPRPLLVRSHRREVRGAAAARRGARRHGSGLQAGARKRACARSQPCVNPPPPPAQGDGADSQRTSRPRGSLPLRPHPPLHPTHAWTHTHKHALLPPTGCLPSRSAPRTSPSSGSPSCPAACLATRATPTAPTPSRRPTRHGSVSGRDRLPRVPDGSPPPPRPCP